MKNVFGQLVFVKLFLILLVLKQKNQTI